MATQVVVLNGGSSSGTTAVARCLQAVLPGVWLRLGVDDLIAALPLALRDGVGSGGVVVGPAGDVAVGEAFRAAEASWHAGIAAIARAGTPVVVDDVFLGGAASQARLRDALAGLEVVWVGVRCAPEAAAAREVARGDRVPGMAAGQALAVHQRVDYDLEVDTTHAESLACARAIAATVT